jgi:hypothetical protein
VGSVNKIPAGYKEALAGSTEDLGELEPIYRTNAKGKPDKETIIGWRPTGKGGARGYFVWLGVHYPASYAALIGRTIPLQVNASATLDATVTGRFTEEQVSRMTLPEKMAALREAIALTKAMPVTYPAPRMIEGEVLDRRTKEG